MTATTPTSQPFTVAAPDPGRLSRVARGSLLNLGGAAVSAASSFGLTIALTRGLSRPVAGVFFSATALFLLATGLGQLGTGTGLVYFVSRSRAEGTLSRVHGLMRTAIRPVIAVALLMAVVTFMAAGPIADAVGGGPHQAVFERSLRVLALAVPLAAVGQIALAGTRGLGTMRPSALLDQTLRASLQFLLVVAVLRFGLNDRVVSAWALPYLVLAVAAWLAWKRVCRRQDVDRAPPSAPVSGRTFWRFTAPRALSSVAQVAMQRFDIVLVGAIAGLPQAAVYAAASRFLALGQLAGSAISQAVQPHLGETLRLGDRRQVQDLYQITTGWLVALTWPLYLLFIVLSPMILRVFGGGYSGGVVVLVVLSASMLVATGCGMVDMVLLMGGRSSWNLINVLVAFAVNLVADLLLIPPFGILGAAIGWALAILASNLLPLAQVATAVKVHPFGRGSLTAMLLSLACFFVVPGLAVLTLHPGWVAVCAGVGVGSIVYVGALWRLRGRMNLSARVFLGQRQRGEG